MLRSKCSLCNYRTVYMTTDPFYEMNGKQLCTWCVDEIYQQKSTHVPVDLNSISTQIHKDQPLDIRNFERCDTHSHRLKLYCDTCECLVCVMCVPSHSGHKFRTSQDKAREVLESFYYVEFVCKYAQLTSVHNSEKFRKLAEDCIAFYSAFEAIGPKEIIEKGSYKVAQATSVFKDAYPKHKNRNLKEVFTNLVTKKQPYVRMETPYLHWCQWKSKTVNLINLQTNEQSAITINIVLPHFCRSIQIAPTKILVCGGRDEPTSNGLSRALVIDIETHTAEKISSMHTGRANHALIYFKKQVFVIGGCDSNNKYTNRCEKLKISKMSWAKIASTNEIRDSTTGIAYPQDNAIYIFGSRRSNNLCMDTIEKYDIFRDVWISLPLSIRFSSMVLGSALLPGEGKKVLVFGGQSVQAQPQKFINVVDLEQYAVEEIPNPMDLGGCVVNETVVYGGHCYALFFKGTSQRIFAKWEGDQWVIQP